MGLKSTTVCLGYQQITSLNSAAGLTPPQGATLALIVPETQNVRWRDDGTNPTASVGMPVFVGASLSYDGDFNKIKFIEETASAKLNVSYYA
jgi:hypothetical protein